MRTTKKKNCCLVETFLFSEIVIYTQYSTTDPSPLKPLKKLSHLHVVRCNPGSNRKTAYRFVTAVLRVVLKKQVCTIKKSEIGLFKFGFLFLFLLLLLLFFRTICQINKNSLLGPLLFVFKS